MKQLHDQYRDQVGFVDTVVRQAHPAGQGVPGTASGWTNQSSDAGTEAGLSRIYARVHTRTDHDAGYVLGALSPAEHQEYQRHLRNCLRCQESLQQLAPVLSLLALAIPDDVGKR